MTNKPNQFIQEAVEILKKEGLNDWSVKISSSGGLCQKGIKKIICLPNDKALFLHEVAHALTPISKDKTGHDAFWGDCFTELVRKYLVKQQQQELVGRLEGIEKEIRKYKCGKHKKVIKLIKDKE